MRPVARRRFLAVAGTSGAGAAFLAACGGSSKNDNQGSGNGAIREATVISSTAVAAATGTPKPGGTLNLAATGNAPLDPYANATFLALTLASFISGRLLKFKTDTDPAVSSRFEIEPDLATSVETPDGLTWTYKLRGGVKWQDVAPVNGRVFDAEDVKSSFERYRAEPKNTNRAAFGTDQDPLLESVTTPDASTVVFKLAKPYGPFKGLTGSPNHVWMTPKELSAGAYDPAKQLIGMGPFILDSIQPDIAYKLKRNPTYYDAPKPYVENIIRSIIPDTTQQQAQFQAGRLDTADIPVTRIDEFRKGLPKANYIEYLSGTYGFLAMQQRGNSPFRDVRVRRAAQMAIDRDSILRLAYGGRGVWNTSSPAIFSRWRVDPKSADMGPGAQWYQFNPAESKKMLAAAGYPNGLPIKYNYTNNIYGDVFNSVAEAVAGMLKEGGFQPQIVTQDYLSEYIKPGTGTFFGNFEGVFYGLQTGFLDPHDYVFNMMHSKSTRNHAGVNDPQLDAMIDKEAAAVNDDDRIKLYKDIERYAADQVFYGSSAIGVAYQGVQEWVKNFCWNLGAYGYGTETYGKLWIDRG
jgi:ABC-type transport system substrate-binding protein